VREEEGIVWNFQIAVIQYIANIIIFGAPIVNAWARGDGLKTEVAFVSVIEGLNSETGSESIKISITPRMQR
jgi:hypothetical protein